MNSTTALLLCEALRLIIGGFVAFLGYRLLNAGLFRVDDVGAIFEKNTFGIIKRSMPGLIALSAGVYLILSSPSRTQLHFSSCAFEDSNPSAIAKFAPLNAPKSDAYIQAMDLAHAKIRSLLSDLEFYLSMIDKDENTLSDLDKERVKRVRLWLGN